MLDIRIGCSHRDIPGVPGLLSDCICLTSVANPRRHIVLHKSDTVTTIVHADDIQVDRWV
jgi:hypothetical protein